MSVKLVESLIRGLETLQVFCGDQNGLRLTEVVKLTGLPKATTYRFLQTLVDQNYLHYFPNSGVFRLGPRAISLGFAALNDFEIADLARPYLEEISKRINQNVNLGILDGVDVVYLVRIKVRSILGINLTVGSRLSVYNSAIGKVLLSSLSQNRLQALLDEISLDPEILRKIGPGGKNFKKQLALIRNQGYAMTDGEVIRGLASVAVPIYGADGVAEAAVNVPVFTELCSLIELREIILPLLMETAKSISQLRGFRAKQA
jgi:IclR family transcriptional regulator, pca regulon regulatory protein